MNKAKHTPGPWSTGAWTAHGQMIRGAKDEYIGYAQGYPNPSKILREVGQAEAEANARLIAAAPEMLEALEQIARVTRMYVAEGITAVDVAIMAAEDAIRKAREGQ